MIFKAIPHNSKCRYGERGAAAAKPKAQIILDAAKVSAASGGNSEPKQGQRSQSARGFCPRSTMRVPQPGIIEHFGNADAVPQLPERCLSRKAGIVRCCLSKTSQKSNANFVAGYALNLCKFHIYHVPYNHNATEEGMEMTQNRIRIVDVADTLGLSSMASKESNPSLTTIHQEANLRAKTAIECLEAMRDGTEYKPQIVLPVDLIKRESTRKL